MARKKSTVAMGLVDLADIVEAPVAADINPPKKKRSRKPGSTVAKKAPKAAVRAVVISVDAATRTSLGVIATRLDRSITWVTARLLETTVAKLATAGEDFLLEAEAMKLR